MRFLLSSVQEPAAKLAEHMVILKVQLAGSGCVKKNRSTVLLQFFGCQVDVSETEAKETRFVARCSYMVYVAAM